MRFSLSSLILAVIFAGSLAGVWIRREPWIKSESKALNPWDSSSKNWPATLKTPSRDGRRLSIPYLFKDRTCEVLDARGHTLARLPLQTWEAEEMAFIDDETIVVEVAIWHVEDRVIPPLPNQLLRRRFPEYWWGNLYRVEVWTGILSGVALMIIGGRRLRAKRKVAA